MSGDTISSARRRVLLSQARRSELKLAKERGELFEARAARAAWSSLVATFRARILAIPRGAAEELVREATRGPAAVEVALTRVLHDALAALSRWEPSPVEMIPHAEQEDTP